MPDASTSTKPTNKERIKEIVAGIEDGIQELFQSEKYFEYLRTMSRFHSYSVNNTILIHLQMPNATAVAGFNQWKNRFGRNVKKGEKGLTIIAPTPFKKRVEEQKLDPDTNLPVLDENGNIIIEEKEIQIPMFKPVKVFDVSQTEGKPLPQLATDLTGDVQQFEAFMEALRRASPVPIEIKPLRETMDGYFSMEDQNIVVREGMSEVQTVCATVHEMGHALLHNREQTALTTAAGTDGDAPKPKDKNTREVEAESVAYAVCAYYGIETGSNSFGYIATWSKDKTLPELRASLETITKTANVLITGIDKHFAEVCKERGIALAERQEETEVKAPAAALPKEALFKLDGKYLHIFQSEGVFAYQIYDANSKKGISGGWIEAPGAKSMREVGEAIAVKRDLDTRGMELAARDMIAELRQANIQRQQQTGPDTPEQFAIDFCEFLEQLHQEGIIENPFTTQSAMEFIPEIAELLRHGQVNGTRETLTEAAKRTAAPSAAASLLRRLDDLRDKWEATLVYGMNQHPFSTGEHDQFYIQQYEKTDKGLIPHEVIYVGSKEDCVDLTKRLNEHRITAQEVREMERREATPAAEQEAAPAPEQPDIATDEYTVPEAGMEQAEAAPEVNDLPDPTITPRMMDRYGYAEPDMLPLSKDRALELAEKDVTIFMLYHDGRAEMAFDPEDIQNHGGIFGVSRDEWESVKGEIPPRDVEKRFMENPKDALLIYQFNDAMPRDRHFTDYDHLDGPPLREHYDAIYTADLNIPAGANLSLDSFYDEYNVHRPGDFTGHSMSVGDILAIKQDGAVSYHYCDSYGFKELPDFNQSQPENYLKNAEMTMEDDANMIDGIINNGPKQPTVEELEAIVNAGGQISLMDLANATHAGREAKAKRPSVMERLNAPLPKPPQKQKSAPKRSAERDR